MSTGQYLESREDEREGRLPGSEKALMAGLQLRAAGIVGCLQIQDTLSGPSHI